ncbi:MAG TPA: DNA polymerase I [Armatimonadetes bacterium]|nr:DNA polymerase I [Armatimonadota bacterium]
MADKRLVILDGYSLLFRAFYATSALSTAAGKPTNALFGFLNMLAQILERQRPDCILVAFDAPGKTFRHADYAEYKATRRETPEALQAQLPEARRIVQALGIPTLELTGYEADDVIGTVTRIAREHGYRTTVVTGDGDALQLVDDWVTVVTPSKGVSEMRTYTPDAVRERYGFGPERIVDFKAIAGDSSDNIPGVPGIGEKGATELIQNFGSAEQILERFAELPPKYQKRIETAKEQMLLSKRLATIQREVPLEIDFQPYRLNPSQLQEALRVLEEFEFRSLVRRLPAVLRPYLDESDEPTPQVGQIAEALEPRRTSASDEAELGALVGDGPFAVLWVNEEEQRTMFEEGRWRAFVATGLNVAEVPSELADRWVALHPGRAIAHDAKPFFRRTSVGSPLRFDALLAGYVLRSDRSSYRLEDLAAGYLDAKFEREPFSLAVVLGLLEAPMRERLRAEEQEAVLDHLELPLTPILAEMEAAGIAVDAAMLQSFSKSLQVQIQQLEAKIHEVAGRAFNIGSPKQLGEVLFEKLGLPGKRTKTGWATGVEVLQDLAPHHEIVADVLAWRELTKLRSTYAESLPKMVTPDGRIHTTFNQTVAATGRLSSNDPNLQNIPVRTELGRQIRRAFVAPQGSRLVSFDYSQIELRLLAHLCGDENLTRAFQEGKDIHAATAALTFGVPEERVTKDQRNRAKLLNYAVLYGVSNYGLAQQMGGAISAAEAKGLIDQYFQRFPKVRQFVEQTVAEARRTGFTRTLWGRRRYFPEINALNWSVRQAAERQAVNAPIQGSSADLIKRAMIDLRPLLDGRRTRLLLQVHDELVFEMPEGEEALIEPLREAMQNAMRLNVPIEADVKLGPNWLDMLPLPKT